MKKTFSERVLFVVSRIPKGKTLSYKEVAEKAGSPCAYRAVGNILNKNYDPKIPCHRVIRSDGVVGGYNRGSILKRKILTKEIPQRFFSRVLHRRGQRFLSSPPR